MKIDSLCLHTRYQQIAMLDDETGELVECRPEHSNGEARSSPRSIIGPVRVGIEATGHTHWFERLLEQLGHEGGSATRLGVLSSSSGTVANSYRYTASEYDAETGLYHYRARYYEPQISRFISEDPLAFNLGVNFYAYVRGNPVMATDPMGLYDWKDVKPAWDHYCDGSGTPWTTSFASINWGDTQNNISIKVKGMVGGGCSNRTIPVSLAMNAQTAGADAFIIGRHTVNVKGNIQVNCDCTWSFKGDMSSKLGYDPYDFDPSNRGTVGETLTWIGSHRCSKKGKPFNINLTGSAVLSAGGKVDGKPTCDCDKNK